MKRRVLIIGGGLAGLTAALSAARAGAATTLIIGGQGAHHLFSGCLDVLAFPPDSNDPAARPLTAAAALEKTHPEHPYAKVGVAQVRRALELFKNDMAEAGCPYEGDGETLREALTVLGRTRPTGLTPQTMTARPDQVEAVCNIHGVANFSAPLLAGELAQRYGHDVTPLHWRPQAERRGILAVARGLADPAFGDALGSFLKEQAAGKTVAIPACLGLERTAEIKRRLEERFGGTLVETPGQPPSVPGLRLFAALRRLLHDHGVRLVRGARAIRPVEDDGRLTGVHVRTGLAIHREPAEAVILATGHLVGGGLLGGRDGLTEPIFGLPVAGPTAPPYFSEEFLPTAGHPVFQTGLRVDDRLRPLVEGKPRFAALFAAGDILAGFDPYRERSGGGVALATGELAGRLAAGGEP